MGLETFDRDGYVVVPGLLGAEEVGLLSQIARADREIAEQKLTRQDGEGGDTELTVVNTLPEDTIYGAIVRSERIVRPMEQFLGGEVYHYHHKMILKQQKTGGAWAWHQDYGYWYSNGCLFPDMASCMIAVDRATVENGCLQVLAGSHRMGRIDHVTVGTQTGADPERMEHVLPKFERVYVELEPGDAVFFHSNLLHRSDQNKSDHPRWAFICCYNAARNNPYKKHHHPCYEPLAVWPHDRVGEAGKAQWNRLLGAVTA
jgi:ectoine hydroxylase-related dioxygenase (phytanoyl-CoA dioxygenase family)